MTYTPACWFPCLVHVLKTKPNEEIKSRCLDTRSNEPEGVRKSNRGGGWHSDSHDEMTNYGSEKLIKSHLHSLFDQSINQVIDGELELVNYWININGKGAYNVKHNHPQAHFSGVYYVHCPQNSGEIIFENPHKFTAFAELSCYKQEFLRQTVQNKSISINPTAGLLLIFPAHLEHSVGVNNSDEERISIGFNCITRPFIPHLGTHDS